MYKLINKFNTTIFLVILVFIYFFSSIANAESTKDNNIHNKFDIIEFNQHKDRFNNWEFFLSDGSKVRRFKAADYYLEHIKLSDSPYIKISAYNKNGVLLQKGTKFYDIKLDMEDYDLQGNMLKKTIYDTSYKLTIEELRKIIQDNFNIDIMNTKQVFALNRFEDKKVTNLPYYLVKYIDQQENQKFHYILVNGNTGEIVHTMDGYFMSEENKDIWQEYLKTRKTK